MNLEFLKPEVFDALVMANIVLGLLIAARRFRKDIGGPLPDDAPAWARSSYDSADSICGADAS